MHVNFIDGFATLQSNEIEVDLATLVDDIKFEDIFGVHFDGIQSQDSNELITEVDFNLFF